MTGFGDAPEVIAVVGPTGSGKSDLALELAVRLDGEIVNTDALQFYRGMDIGTAKVPEAQRRGIPHHLLDVLDVTEESSVAQFQASVREVIGDITARAGDRSSSRIGALRAGALDELEFPPTDAMVRARFEIWPPLGLDGLRERLRESDPPAPNGSVTRDDGRAWRARVTGRPFSSFMPGAVPTATVRSAGPGPSPVACTTAPAREGMGGRAVEEVRSLDAAGLRTPDGLRAIATPRC